MGWITMQITMGRIPVKRSGTLENRALASEGH